MSWGQDLPLGKAHHASPQQTVLLTKPEGYVMFMALGKRCLPCHVAWRTVSPWVPCVSAFKFLPLFSGDLGGLACCSPLLSSLLHAARFLCCQIGPLSPGSALGGGGTGFLLTLPCLGTVDTQVPCVEPSLLVSFSHIWADPRGTNFSLSSPPFWVDGAPPGSTWEGEEESLLPTLVQELGTFVREERSRSSLSKAAPYIS